VELCDVFVLQVEGVLVMQKLLDIFLARSSLLNSIQSAWVFQRLLKRKIGQ
jgi:hypothetical protein